MTSGILALLIAYVFYQVVRDGTRGVLRTVYVVVLFAVPVWMMRVFGVFKFDFRAAVAYTLLVALIFRPTTGAKRLQFLLGDLFCLTMWTSDVITSIWWDDVTFTSPLESLRLWVLPYLMGRLLARDPDDLAQAAKVLWWVGIYLGGYALFEAITKINPINQFFNKFYWILEQGEGYRWGMKRAQGPLEHPIFFGMMLAMLLPWAVQAAPRYGRWGFVSPLMIGLGMFVTVSRGAWIVGIIVVVAMLFFRRPSWRLPIAICVVLAGVVVAMGQKEVISFLGQIIGEKERFKEYIQVKGHLREYTGTLHRALLSEVYVDALRQAGWFGYGSYDNVRVPFPSETDGRFRSIDDNYLAFQLQYGLLGIIAFLLLGGCGLVYLFWSAWNAQGRFTPLAAGLFGACAAIMLALNSVIFSADFSGVWLFSMGVATGLERLRRLNREAMVREARSDPPMQGPLRRLPQRNGIADR